MSESSSVKKYLAEMLGAFVLVLMGCGSAVLAGSAIGFVGISFAFGLSVLAMVYAVGVFLVATLTMLCPYLCWLQAK